MKKCTHKKSKIVLLILTICLALSLSQSIYVFAEEYNEYGEYTEYNENGEYVENVEEIPIVYSPEDIKNSIATLPAINAIQSSDGENIANIKSQYESLTAEEKALVDNYSVLESAEQRIKLINELTNAAYSSSYKFEKDTETILKIVYAETQPSIMMLSPAGKEFIIMTETVNKDDVKTISDNNFEMTVTAISGEDALLFTITKCDGGLWKINSTSPVSITTQEKEEPTTEEPTTEQMDTVISGWTIMALTADMLPEEILSLYNSIDKPEDLALIAYIGKREGVTSDYAFLCTDAEGYKTMVISVDGDGNANMSANFSLSVEEGQNPLTAIESIVESINNPIEEETTEVPTDIPGDIDPSEEQNLLQKYMMPITVGVIVIGVCIAGVIILNMTKKKNKNKNNTKNSDENEDEDEEIKTETKTKKTTPKKEEKETEPPKRQEQEKPKPDKKKKSGQDDKKVFVPRTEDVPQLTEEEEIERIRNDANKMWEKLETETDKSRRKPIATKSTPKEVKEVIVTQQDLDEDVTVEEFDIVVGEHDGTDSSAPTDADIAIQKRRTFFPEDRFNF